MAPLAAERSIAIIQDCAHPALAAHADRQRLSQILVNLISNAVKYNHRGGTITITCQEDGAGQVSVMISDTGPGIHRKTSSAFSSPSNGSAPNRPRSKAPGSGCPWPSPHRGHGRPADRIERPR